MRNAIVDLHGSKRILFILKRREDYNSSQHYSIGMSTGLYNSALFVNDMLTEENIISKIAVVVDNNGIDREVTLFNPTHVIIEALWVVPTKFTELQALHPNVNWIIRLHSELPFLANEGIALDWVGDYLNFRNVSIACNAPKITASLRRLDQLLNNKHISDKIIYLPNYYPKEYVPYRSNFKKFSSSDFIDVGCFGAVRPLKNHLIQAFAAIQFAEDLGKKVIFHINSGRIEMKGDSVASNLKSLFQHLADKGHQLINHEWAPREEFLQLCSQMDICLQVSFSETFNIVAADIISQGVPIVGSNEIYWLEKEFNASPTDDNNICRKLHEGFAFAEENVSDNQMNLDKYTTETKLLWLNYFK